MRTIALIVGLSFSASACLAAGPVPRMTGEELVERFNKSAAAPWTERNNEFLSGYLAGVADASVGKDWCDTTRVKTIEIDSDVLEQLRGLRPENRRTNAAPLVVSALKKKFPCPPTRNAR